MQRSLELKKDPRLPNPNLFPGRPSRGPIDRADREVFSIFIYKSPQWATQEQSSAGAKMFRGASRPRGEQAGRAQRLHCGSESHPAFGVYLTNKARRAYLFTVWHHRARARDHYRAAQSDKGEREREKRSPSTLRRVRLTVRWQRASFRLFAAASRRMIPHGSPSGMRGYRHLSALSLNRISK